MSGPRKTGRRKRPRGATRRIPAHALAWAWCRARCEAYYESPPHLQHLSDDAPERRADLEAHVDTMYGLMREYDHVASDSEFSDERKVKTRMRTSASSALAMCGCSARRNEGGRSGPAERPRAVHRLGREWPVASCTATVLTGAVGGRVWGKRDGELGTCASTPRLRLRAAGLRFRQPVFPVLRTRPASRHFEIPHMA